jgi:diguanylate cyclase (GGDEF)-like protein
MVSPIWLVLIRSPFGAPREYVLPAGRSTIGRKPDNDIVIADSSASRVHAAFEYDPSADSVVIRDLGSRNGTFVNHERLSGERRVVGTDQLRIGQHLIRLSRRGGSEPETVPAYPETQPLTLDLMLESVEQHAVLLYEVAMRLNMVSDLSKALQEVTRILQVALGADKCAVILADQFEQLSYMGFPTTIARQAIEQRLVVAIPDTDERPDLNLRHSGRLLQVRSVICIPVMIADEVAGLLYIYNTQRSSRLFTDQDIRLAIAISHQAALTIQRARLMQKTQQLEELASTDPLTGLFNRRHFLDLAEREVKRARRYRRPLAVVVIDLDHFQDINDRHGQAVGDAVLQAASVRLQATLRDIDLMGRFGGDEFIALLVEGDRASAEYVAARCQRSLAESPVTTAAGLVTVTACVGYAAIADRHTDASLLINEATAALAAAKGNGSPP